MAGVRGVSASGRLSARRTGVCVLYCRQGEAGRRDSTYLARKDIQDYMVMSDGNT